MLIRKHNWAVCLMAFVIAGSISGSPVVMADERDFVAGEMGEAIRKHVDYVHDRLGFSGVVLAGRDDELVAVVPRGFADEAGTKPLVDTTLFEIASCTKTFTAIAVLQLAESGKLSLDDSIAVHLPKIPSNCKAITIRHLLAHTSGIPGTNTTGSGVDVEKVIPTFLLGGPKQVPGINFEYWNQGYALLSEIIARASGVPYRQYVRDNIFETCQMTSSRFTGDEAAAGTSVAVGRSIYGASRSALEHPYGDEGFQYRAMGGLVTNVRDLWDWDRAMQRHQLIMEASWKEMTAPGPTNYGLGCVIEMDPSGKDSYQHTGSVRGFHADVRRHPSINGAVFILSNSDDLHSFAELAGGVEQILFGNQPNTNLPGRLANESMQAIAGRYQDARDRTMVIEKGERFPSIQIDWGGPVTAGVVGLNQTGVPSLFMTKRAKGGLKFILDGELEIVPMTGKTQSVSLLVLDPKLTFQRVD